ncbi:uncharacterized protein VTP21DRAFT_8214 [Calcarisporiella thermophila]|uniref:uncharacterized protein n=1 Tax=Calcarisporiella thermophila TaxID=911321 RepID=UPI00374441B3
MEENKHDKSDTLPPEYDSKKPAQLQNYGDEQADLHENSSTQLEKGGEDIELHSAGKNDANAGEEVPFRLSTKTLLAYICLCLVIFMRSLDEYVFSAVLPNIASEFNAASQMGILGTSTFLVLTASQPLYSKMSDRVGRKETFLVSLVFFIIGTAISGKSENMDMLIVGRSINALGGTGIDVNVQIIISDLFPLLHRGKWLSYFEIVYIITVGIGPVIGGALVDKGAWQWCFYLQLPICGLILIATYFLIDVKRDTPKLQWKDLTEFDWVGNIFLAASTICLLLGLNWGGTTYPWDSPTIIVLLVVGVVLGLIFLWIEHKFAKDPILPLRLFRIRNAWCGYAAGFLFAFTSMGLFYFLPIYFQIAKSYTPTVAGVQRLAYNATAVLSSIIIGIVVAVTREYRLYIFVCLSIYTLGLGLTILMNQYSHAAEIVAYQAILGLGGGSFTIVLLLGIQAATEQKDIAITTTLLTFFRLIGSTFGTSIFGGIWLATIKNSILAAVPPGTPEDVVTNAQNSVTYILELDGNLKSIIIQAYVDAMRVLAILATVGSALVILLCLPMERYLLKENLGSPPQKLRKDEGNSEWNIIRRLFRIKKDEPQNE